MGNDLPGPGPGPGPGRYKDERCEDAKMGNDLTYRMNEDSKVTLRVFFDQIDTTPRLYLFTKSKKVRFSLSLSLSLKKKAEKRRASHLSAMMIVIFTRYAGMVGIKKK